MEKNPNKFVIFDMDETLGQFVEFSVFWNVITNFYNIEEDDKTQYFYDVFDLYPEFIRSGMFSLLKKLYKEKVHNRLAGIYIFTNNGGGREWVDLIRDYFTRRLGIPNLFDRTIYAYKSAHGVIVEKNRREYGKTYADLLRSAPEISPNSKICFIDDQKHIGMLHKNVTYLKIKSYDKIVPYNELIERFLQKNNRSNDEDFRWFAIYQMIRHYSPHAYTHGIVLQPTPEQQQKELLINTIIANKLKNNIFTFMKSTRGMSPNKNKTRRNRSKSKGRSSSRRRSRSNNNNKPQTHSKRRSIRRRRSSNK